MTEPPPKGLSGVLTDLAGMGQVGTALVDLVARSVGWVTEPIQQRRLLKVEEDRIIRLAEANAMADYIRTGDEGLRLRAGQRLLQRELTRQRNLEAAMSDGVRLAFDELTREGSQPQPPGDDWMAQYQTFVENISEDRLRQIWARLLANQVNPNRAKVSLATLDALRLVEPHHAETFLDCCRMWSAFGTIQDVWFDFEEETGLEFTTYSHDIQALVGLGLLTLVTRPRSYLSGQGYSFLFLKNDDPHDAPLVTADTWYDADYVSVQPSWIGHELMAILYPALALARGGTEGEAVLGRWANLKDRVEVLISWRKTFSSLPCKIVLARHPTAKPVPDSHDLYRSDCIPTHWFDPFAGRWTRLRDVPLEEVFSYPEEIRRMLELDTYEAV
jgi:hypothetical protein